eukprot:evm.model.scf_356.1 EVM.evm.TU.scf_356.1   scf_356:18330-25178(-)
MAAALGLTILFNERGFLEGREDSTLVGQVRQWNLAEREVLTSVLLIAWAAFAGILSFLLLVPNIKIIRRRASHRFWMMLAILALGLSNLFGVFDVLGARNAFEWKVEMGSFVSPVGHYFILAVFGLTIIMVDIFFLRVIFKRYLDETERHPDIPMAFASPRSSQNVDIPQGLKPVMPLYDKFANCVIGIFHWFYSAANSNVIFSMTDSLRKSMPSKGPRGIFSCIKTVDGWISTTMFDFLWWLWDTRPLMWLMFLISGPWKALVCITNPVCRPIANWTAQARNATRATPLGIRMWRVCLMAYDHVYDLVSGIKPMIQREAEMLCDAVTEDDEYHHSGWMKAAVLTAAILIVYFGLWFVAVYEGFLDEVYSNKRNCLIENEPFSQFFLSTVGFNLGTDLAPQISVDDFCNRVTAQLESRSETSRLYSCSTLKREEFPDLRLAAINVFLAEARDRGAEEPYDRFTDRFSGKFVIFWDTILLKTQWTCWVGYGVGLVMGAYTLVTVLGQYKRLTLAIRAEWFEDVTIDKGMGVSNRRNKEALMEIAEKALRSRSWNEVTGKYPMSHSMFFFGMLVSTAVLQLLVFGALVTYVLAFALSITELFDIIKPLVALAVALALVWFIQDVVSQWIILEGFFLNRYKVLQESWFLLFLLMNTITQLVIGIFFALWRFVLLLLTSITGLNRLDRNLFPIWKNLDFGQQAFLATVLMESAFYTRRICKTSQAESGSDDHTLHDPDAPGDDDGDLPGKLPGPEPSPAIVSPEPPSPADFDGHMPPGGKRLQDAAVFGDEVRSDPPRFVAAFPSFRSNSQEFTVPGATSIATSQAEARIDIDQVTAYQPVAVQRQVEMPELHPGEAPEVEEAEPGQGAETSAASPADSARGSTDSTMPPPSNGTSSIEANELTQLSPRKASDSHSAVMQRRLNEKKKLSLYSPRKMKKWTRGFHKSGNSNGGS